MDNYFMQDSDPLFEHVRSIMTQVMAVLYTNGYQKLHVGGMMRLIGVDDIMAKHYDLDRIDIDGDFVKQLAASLVVQETPPGVTVH